MKQALRPAAEVECKARLHLEQLLGRLPGVQLQRLTEPDASDSSPDLVATALVHRRLVVFVAEIKQSGEPRYVRAAIDRLRSHLLDHHDHAPLVMAPYLSEQARALCKEKKIGYLDFEGNCHIELTGLLIDREVAGKPPAERRAFKSVFHARSALVLRAMLHEPQRPWRLSELSKVAGVSLGQTSNVKSALLDREWATATDDGLILSQPNQLLDSWRDIYEPPRSVHQRLYTPLHGRALEGALRDVLPRANEDEAAAILSSFSAAEWLAPYTRNSTLFLYANAAGLKALTDPLGLTPTPSGENVSLKVLADLSVLGPSVRAAEGIVSTSPVQTYLDLWLAGERGREAAEHLRRERLQWPT